MAINSSLKLYSYFGQYSMMDYIFKHLKGECSELDIINFFKIPTSEIYELDRVIKYYYREESICKK